jgi:hypothetical protein
MGVVWFVSLLGISCSVWLERRGHVPGKWAKCVGEIHGSMCMIKYVTLRIAFYGVYSFKNW